MTSVQSQSQTPAIDYLFDRVFTSSHTQEDIYNYSADGIVADLMDGYNGTVCAYGQSGSGKTHTMMGDINDEMNKGLMPRIVEAIFQKINASSVELEFIVKVAFMEIYQEKIKDLLNPTNTHLPIHESKSEGVFVKGILELPVSSIQEVLIAMHEGQKERTIASTVLNSASSRSHSIFVIKIHQKNIVTGVIKTGKLSLVDLAGSEKISKTGSSGQVLEEAKKINLSLSALGMVINALTDPKSSHVPYRDSKLTRILQESLGGNSKTTLIINCSPSSYNTQETLSTLRFGVRAKRIKNKTWVNLEESSVELKVLLRDARIEIKKLELLVETLTKELGLWRIGKSILPINREVGSSDIDNLADIAPAYEAASMPPTVQDSSIASAIENLSIPSSKVISIDEVEHYLRRENAFEDQISEYETKISAQNQLIDSLTQESEIQSKHYEEVVNKNKDMKFDIHRYESRIQEMDFEVKECRIIIESLQEYKLELKSHFTHLKEGVRRNDFESVCSHHIGGDNVESKLCGADTIMSMELINEIVDTDINEDIYNATIISRQIIESLDISDEELLMEDTSRSADVKQADRDTEFETLKHSHIELEASFKALQEVHYQSQIENMPQNTSSESISSSEKSKHADSNSYELKESHFIDLQTQLIGKKEEITNLKLLVAEHLQKSEELTATFKSIETSRPSDPFKIERDELQAKIKVQVYEFDALKNKLMNDLQSRCERVIELESLLQSSRYQYTDTQDSINTQEKMELLELNLLKLTGIQDQLIDQNSNSKRDLELSERRLVARNDRVATLEQNLTLLQAKMLHQEQQFERQLSVLQYRFKESQVRVESSWAPSSKIIKPLRGGVEQPSIDSYSDDRKKIMGESFDSPRTKERKKSSWYINLLKK